MSDIYSISLEGLRRADQLFNLAARNVANGRSKAQTFQVSAPSDLVQLSSAGPVTGSPSFALVDYATETVTIIEAKLGFETNFKVTATQQQLDRSTLDLLA